MFPGTKVAEDPGPPQRKGETPVRNNGRLHRRLPRQLRTKRLPILQPNKLPVERSPRLRRSHPIGQFRDQPQLPKSPTAFASQAPQEGHPENTQGGPDGRKRQNRGGQRPRQQLSPKHLKERGDSLPERPRERHRERQRQRPGQPAAGDHLHVTQRRQPDGHHQLLVRHAALLAEPGRGVAGLPQVIR